MDEKTEMEFAREVHRISDRSYERHIEGECEGFPGCSFCFFAKTHAPDVWDV